MKTSINTGGEFYLADFGYFSMSVYNFLHYPEIIPDSRTIWLFRERLSSTGKDKIIWKEMPYVH